MELRQLRYFVAVAETLNFSRAAETLYISQSALSQQIAELERELNVTLLHRSKRSVKLTPAGQTLLAEAKPLLHQSEKIVPLVRHVGDGPAVDRKLYIGLDQSVNLYLNPKFHCAITDTIYSLRQTTPGLRATFSFSEQETLTRDLDMGRVDFGLFYSFGPDIQGNNEFVNQELQKDEMVLLLRSEESLEDTPESVAHVLRTRGLYLLERELSGMGQILHILESTGIHPHIRFCDNRGVMILTAASGESATILPLSIAQGLRDPSLTILHFRIPEAQTRLLAVWKKENCSPLIPQVVAALSDGLKRK